MLLDDCPPQLGAGTGLTNPNISVRRLAHGRPSSTSDNSSRQSLDLATAYATKGATFDVWYAEAVGEGKIIDTTPVPSAEARHAYDLTDRERQLLMSGISEWGGPSRCSDAMAQAMGFKSVENLFEEGQRLCEHLRFAEPMSTADWARALGATETCFISSLGSTIDWEITTGFRDDETIELIRGLQIKLVEVVKAMRGGDL